MEDGHWPADQAGQPYAPHLFPLSSQLAPSSYPQKQSLARFSAQHQVSGADLDADTSVDPVPVKKAWELEVERLRLAKLQQQVSGTSTLIATAQCNFHRRFTPSTRVWNN